MIFQDKSDYFETGADTAANMTSSSESGTAPADQPGIPDSDEPDDKEPDNQDPAPRPRHRFRNFMLWVASIAIITASIAFYIRYCNPYVVDAHESGKIANVEKRGILFKTYEADVAARSLINDTSVQYTRQKFSFANDSLARIAQDLQMTGQEAELTYSRYFATLPWRGASTKVITGIKAARNNQELPENTPDLQNQIVF